MSYFLIMLIVLSIYITEVPVIKTTTLLDQYQCPIIGTQNESLNATYDEVREFFYYHKQLRTSECALKPQ